MTVVAILYIVNKMFILFSVLTLSYTGTNARTMETRYQEQSQQYLYRPNINGWIKVQRVAASSDEAYTKCRNEGAELASPTTKELVSVMRELIEANNYSGQYLIDVRAVYVTGVFSSTKGVPFSSMPVRDMVQLLDREDGDCLSMDRQQIRVVSCGSRLPYFCYKHSQEGQVLTACGTYDIQYKLNKTGNCYKFHNEPMTWDEAYSTCVDEGGYLTVINDKHEAAAVKEMFQLSCSPFIGLAARKGDGIWKSIHEDPVNSIYNVWHVYQHTQTDDRYRCAVLLSSDAQLYPMPCEEKRCSVCEKDPQYKQFSS